MARFVFGVPLILLLASVAFTQKMEAKLNSNSVPICAPESYDAMTALIQGLKQVGTNPDKLQATIRAENFTGESGIISFDSNGDLQTANYVVKKIESGALVQI